MVNFGPLVFIVMTPMMLMMMLMFVHDAVLASVGQARSLWWVSCCIRWWRTEVGHCGHSACLSVHNVCCQHWLLTSTVHLTEIQSVLTVVVLYTWQAFSLCWQFSYCTLDGRSVYVPHLTRVQFMFNSWQTFSLCWQLLWTVRCCCFVMTWCPSVCVQCYYISRDA